MVKWRFHKLCLDADELHEECLDIITRRRNLFRRYEDEEMDCLIQEDWKSELRSIEYD